MIRASTILKRSAKTQTFIRNALCFFFFASLISTTTTTQARSDGAFGCDGGKPAVGGPHTNGDFGTPVRGTLDDGGNQLVVSGVALDAERVPNIIGPPADDTASSIYQFEVRSYDRVPFKGALVRFEVTSGNSVVQFAVTPQENNSSLVKAADDVCFGPEVQGITHKDSSYKLELQGSLYIATPGATVEFTVDVTVVDFNNVNSGSQFWYSQYIVAFEATAPAESPTAAPPTTTDVPPTSAPTTQLPTTAVPTAAAPTIDAPQPKQQQGASGGIFDNICFAGDTAVTLEDGSRRPMHQLRVGDRVAVFDYAAAAAANDKNDNVNNHRYYYEPVYAFAKRDAAAVAEFVRMEWNNSNNNSSTTTSSFLEISPKHLLLARTITATAPAANVDDDVDGDRNNNHPPNTATRQQQQQSSSAPWTMIPASHLQPGKHQIKVLEGEAATEAVVTVQSIRRIQACGAFAPLTFSGTILVHGNNNNTVGAHAGGSVCASTYVSMQNAPHLRVRDMTVNAVSWHWLAHTFVTPMRYFGRACLLLQIDCLSWWLPTFFDVVDRHVLAALTRLPAAVSLPLLVIPAVALLGLVSLMESVIFRAIMSILMVATNNNSMFVWHGLLKSWW